MTGELVPLLVAGQRREAEMLLLPLQVLRIPRWTRCRRLLQGAVDGVAASLLRVPLGLPRSVRLLPIGVTHREKG